MPQAGVQSTVRQSGDCRKNRDKLSKFNFLRLLRQPNGSSDTCPENRKKALPLEKIAYAMLARRKIADGRKQSQAVFRHLTAIWKPGLSRTKLDIFIRFIVRCIFLQKLQNYARNYGCKYLAEDKSQNY